MSDVAIQLLTGLSVASILFLVSSGLTLVFGALRLINLAHGSFYMYGAYVVATVVGATALDSAVPFWIALVVAPSITAALALALELVVMRRIYRADHLVQLLATFAVMLVFADIALQLWGPEFRGARMPDLLSGHVDVGGNAFPTYRLFVIAVAAMVALGLWIMLDRTRLGWQVRAILADEELAEASGIDVRRIVTFVFVLAAGLAGLGGAVVAPQVSIGPGIDGSIIVEAFVVTIVGGLGSIAGAAIAAVLIGVVQAVGVATYPQAAAILIYLLMMVVLLVRPWGLLGREE